MCLTVEQINDMLARGEDVFSFGEPLPVCRLALTPTEALCRGLARAEMGDVGEGRIAARAEAIYLERKGEIDAAIAQAEVMAGDAINDLRQLREAIVLCGVAMNNDTKGEDK